jgi:hypothetical protein
MGIATDGDGNVYVTGYTGGTLEVGYVGNGPSFVRAYDGDGHHRWTRQFGTSSSDETFGIATDASGNVYAAGFTVGDLDGDNAGFADAFIRSYDRDGHHRWTRQFGTSDYDRAQGVATDAAGNVYATGQTQGKFEDSNFGGRDVFIRSYDSAGNGRWTRQFGTSGNDGGYGITTGADGHVYATGSTLGALEGSNFGGIDVFIRSYDSSGTLRWTRQFGTPSDDGASDLAVGANGDLYVVGETLGQMTTTAAAGSYDAYVRKYGP